MRAQGVSFCVFLTPHTTLCLLNFDTILSLSYNIHRYILNQVYIWNHPISCPLTVVRPSSWSSVMVVRRRSVVVLVGWLIKLYPQTQTRDCEVRQLPALTRSVLACSPFLFLRLSLFVLQLSSNFRESLKRAPFILAYQIS